jgi:hypothetical protein
MITTTSKNNSFNCVEDVCAGQDMSCRECNVPVSEQIHPLRKYLRSLWQNIRLFVEANKWGPIVTLKVGDSHYMMKMDEIEARWRNQ